MAAQLLSVLDAHEGRVCAVRFSPDGAHLASGAFGGDLKLWETQNWTQVRGATPHESSVNAIAFAGSGARLVSGGTDSAVRVTTVRSFKSGPPITGHKDTVIAVDTDRSGRSAVSASYDGTVRCWTLSTGAQRWVRRLGERHAMGAAFAGSGAVVASGPDGEIVLLDAKTGQPGLSVTAPEGMAVAMRVPSDADQVVTAHPLGSLVVRDLSDLSPAFGARVGESGSYPVGASADGRILAMGWDHHVGIFDVGSGPKPIAVVDVRPKGVYAVDVSPDGSVVACGAADRRIRVWAID